MQHMMSLLDLYQELASGLEKSDAGTPLEGTGS